MSLTVKLLPVIEEPAAEHHEKQSAGEVQPQNKIVIVFFLLRETYTSLQPLRRSVLTRRVGEEISTRGGGTVECPEWVMRDENGKEKRRERCDWEWTRLRGFAIRRGDRGREE